MTTEEVAGYIDLTLLRPDATIREIENLAGEALRYPFASVCVPPCHVRRVASILGESPVKVCTVVGFPLGYQSTDVKVQEGCEYAEAGADEIDMVMNISMFKSGELGYVEDEISEVVSALSGLTVKVIIETSCLTDEEKKTACDLVARGGAAYVKTSTGFGQGGATPEDVRLLAAAAAGRIKVKASGGIKTLEDAMRMISAGASRIGTSSGTSIIQEFQRGLK